MSTTRPSAEEIEAARNLAIYCMGTSSKLEHAHALDVVLAALDALAREPELEVESQERAAAIVDLRAQLKRMDDANETAAARTAALEAQVARVRELLERWERPAGPCVAFDNRWPFAGSLRAALYGMMGHE